MFNDARQSLVYFFSLKYLTELYIEMNSFNSVKNNFFTK